MNAPRIQFNQRTRLGGNGRLSACLQKIVCRQVFVAQRGDKSCGRCWLAEWAKWNGAGRRCTVRPRQLSGKMWEVFLLFCIFYFFLLAPLTELLLQTLCNSMHNPIKPVGGDVSWLSLSTSRSTAGQDTGHGTTLAHWLIKHSAQIKSL